MKRNPAHRLARRAAVLALAAAALSATQAARASFLSGDALDAVADVMAWVVLIIVPIVVIVVFWLVHVMPEKLAYKRHHPQAQAIHTLCLLSLVFGGLLWPIAWLWTFTKPVVYKVAYGTEKHETYFADAEEKARSGRLTSEERSALLHELDAIEARGPLPSHLRKLRDYLAERDAQAAIAEAADGRSA